jgi:hypothetical protein
MTMTKAQEKKFIWLLEQHLICFCEQNGIPVKGLDGDQLIQVVYGDDELIRSFANYLMRNRVEYESEFEGAPDPEIGNTRVAQGGSMNNEMELFKQPFYRIFWLFGMAALTKQKAEYLIGEQDELDLSTDEIREVNKEYNLAKSNLSRYFNEMMEEGIPQHMLPKVLQIDNPEQDSDDDDDDE